MQKVLMIGGPCGKGRFLMREPVDSKVTFNQYNLQAEDRETVFTERGAQGVFAVYGETSMTTEEVMVLAEAAKE